MTLVAERRPPKKIRPPRRELSGRRSPCVGTIFWKAVNGRGKKTCWPSLP